MKGILLGNLGTPQQPNKNEIAKYLKEFLMDPFVIDIHWLLRWILVNLIIIPLRLRRLVKAYQSIWTKKGSPLLYYSNEQKKALEKTLKIPVALAMNYGEPNIQNAIEKLQQQGVNEIICFLLYPHYALSSYEAMRQKVLRVCSKYPNIYLKFSPVFYNHKTYIKALSSLIKKCLPKSYDHILFSYHGIPEKHIKKVDKTGLCKINQNCCENLLVPHDTCYRAQVIKTTKLTASQLNLTESKYSISFQSRLGATPWLKPFTDHIIPKLAEKGIKNLVVVCPSFTSDCLETLEEIGIRARKSFIESGGHQMYLLPCLNNDPQWIQAICSIIQEVI